MKKKIIIDMNKVKIMPCYVCGQSSGHNKALHQNDIEIKVINGNDEAPRRA